MSSMRHGSCMCISAMFPTNSFIFELLSRGTIAAPFRLPSSMGQASTLGNGDTDP